MLRAIASSVLKEEYGHRKTHYAFHSPRFLVKSKFFPSLFLSLYVADNEPLMNTSNSSQEKGSSKVPFFDSSEC